MLEFRKTGAVLLLLLAFVMLPAFAQEADPTEEYPTYVIQPGDTQITIALRFDTTVSAIMAENGLTDRATIYWGQTIRIPPVPVNPDITPEPTATTGPTTTYVVRSGELLNQIAQRYNTTVNELLILNPTIGSANLIYAGQVINVPASAEDSTAVPVTEAATLEATTLPTALPPAEITSTPPVETEATAEVTSEPTRPVISSLPNADFDFGIDANFLLGDPNITFNQVQQLGVNWVKQEVRWSDYEATPGQINLVPLDSVVDALNAQGVNILFTVAYAPAWSRSIQEENGPPDNFANFGAFMSTLATRYAGRVQAYEIWNEPNLRSRWKSTLHPISAASYVDLLRHGYDAVKAADPQAQVISAGLAPTGFNDAANAEAGNLQVNAMDDHVFLRDLYAAGFTQYIDAIGVHPMGWANPPAARCCEAAPGVSTHFESEHFYFLNTLETYKQIMDENGDSGRNLWVTKFGWGTYEGVTNAPSDANNIFISYLNQQQQATYLVGAFEIGQALGYVGPMFAYNLNACPAVLGYDLQGCFYSLTDISGNPRPAFAVLAALDKSPVSEQPPAENVQPAAEVTPEMTPAA